MECNCGDQNILNSSLPTKKILQKIHSIVVFSERLVYLFLGNLFDLLSFFSWQKNVNKCTQNCRGKQKPIIAGVFIRDPFPGIVPQRVCFPSLSFLPGLSERDVFGLLWKFLCFGLLAGWACGALGRIF